jgi:hypothetical protein
LQRVRPLLLPNKGRSQGSKRISFSVEFLFKEASSNGGRDGIHQDQGHYNVSIITEIVSSKHSFVVLSAGLKVFFCQLCCLVACKCLFNEAYEEKGRHLRIWL